MTANDNSSGQEHLRAPPAQAEQQRQHALAYTQAHVASRHNTCFLTVTRTIKLHTRRCRNAHPVLQILLHPTAGNMHPCRRTRVIIAKIQVFPDRRFQVPLLKRSTPSTYSITLMCPCQTLEVQNSSFAILCRRTCLNRWLSQQDQQIRRGTWSHCVST